MKAIILAGGEGTRLQPLTILRPKPMIPLFDKPLLEHLVLLLKENGFTEICMTLRYLSKSIQDWFGSGEELGVWIEYRMETEPRGTAGSVRDCADFIDGEDFLVVSGDAACSFDLRAFYEKHRISGADATILTHESGEPAEYGLVLTDADGTIRSFLEKPSRENIVTNCINTGIYALSAGILSEIPENGACDFGSDLFPKLLHDGRRIRTWQPEGYWNDIGTPEAYLQTCRDILDGKFPLPIPGKIQYRDGLPFWVSPEAKAEADSYVGPYSVIGAGSHLGSACEICGSMLHAATLERNVCISGAILAENVHVSSGSRIADGAILADGVFVGSGCTIREGVKIWPQKRIPGNQVYCESITRSASAAPLHFSEGAIMEGVYGENLMLIDLFRMGSARFPAKRAAAASAGGNVAALLAEEFLLGSGSQGREAFLLDASTPACASFTASQFGMELTLFVWQEGAKIKLYFFDKAGLPVSRSVQRTLEAAVHSAVSPAPSRESRTPTFLFGTEERMISFATAGKAVNHDYPISVNGSGLFKRCLRLLGANVVPPAYGIPEFTLSADGFQLSVIDERGRGWEHDSLLAAYAAVCFSEGQHAVVFPASIPHRLHEIAACFGGSILLAEESGALSQAQTASYHWGNNGILLCVRLLSSLQNASMTVAIADLMDSLPRAYRKEKILDTESSEIAILRKLIETEEATVRNGILLPGEDGIVRLRRVGRNQLKILAESSKAEIASELCDTCLQKLKAFDRQLHDIHP